MQDGVIREVKEEAGLDFTPTSMIKVMSRGRNYLLVAFVGEVVGKSLLLLAVILIKWDDIVAKNNNKNTHTNDVPG